MKSDDRKECRTDNRRLAQWRVTWLIEHSTSHQLLWYVDSFELRNPPLRQAPKRCIQYIFRTYAERFSPIFTRKIYWNCYRKILCENWKPNRTLSIKFVLKIRFRKIRCEIKNWNQTLRENLLCVTIRTLRWVLFLSSENIILYTTAV